MVRGSKTFNNKEFLDLIWDICNSCSVCLRFKRPPPQPVVGLTLENRFNDTVCLDLKEQYWILHLSDTSMRYSAVRLIKTNKSEEIIHKIFLMWISYFGPSKCFFSDNEGEFNDEGYQQMNEKLNIEICSTAVESPFSNGTVEYHNLIIAEAIEKTLEGEKWEPEITLALAVRTKNALQNHLWHISNELNINTPSILTNQLPGLEDATTSEMVKMPYIQQGKVS